MFQLVMIQILLPISFIYSLWKTKAVTRVDWIIQLIFTVLFISWIFFTGRWDWFGYYTRYIWVLLLIPAIWKSFKKAKELPVRKRLKFGQKFSRGVYITLAIIFGLYHILLIPGSMIRDDAINLVFPLKDGTYYVGHGGASSLINYHHTYEPQKYAIDLLKLNQFGTRANGIYPKQLEPYAIYGDTLYSPCTGEVAEVTNDATDLTPGEMEPEQPFGNYVGIVCEGTDAIVYLAHMQEGSVRPKQGEVVSTGEPLGKVGNSGNTTTSPYSCRKRWYWGTN